MSLNPKPQTLILDGAGGTPMGRYSRVQGSTSAGQEELDLSPQRAQDQGAQKCVASACPFPEPPDTRRLERKEFLEVGGWLEFRPKP